MMNHERQHLTTGGVPQQSAHKRHDDGAMMTAFAAVAVVWLKVARGPNVPWGRFHGTVPCSVSWLLAVVVRVPVVVVANKNGACPLRRLARNSYFFPW